MYCHLRANLSAKRRQHCSLIRRLPLTATVRRRRATLIEITTWRSTVFSSWQQRLSLPLLMLLQLQMYAPLANFGHCRFWRTHLPAPAFTRSQNPTRLVRQWFNSCTKRVMCFKSHGGSPHTAPLAADNRLFRQFDSRSILNLVDLAIGNSHCTFQ